MHNQEGSEKFLTVQKLSSDSCKDESSRNISSTNAKQAKTKATRRGFNQTQHEKLKLQIIMKGENDKQNLHKKGYGEDTKRKSVMVAIDSNMAKKIKLKIV